MNRSYIKTIYKPTSTNPVFLQSISNSDQCSLIVRNFLFNYFNFKKFAEFYSPYFPDYIIAKRDGLCSQLKYEFFVNNLTQPNIILLVGNIQPPRKNSYANYEIFTTIFNYIKNLGCKTYMSFGTITINHSVSTIYISATSKKLVTKVIKKFGGKIFKWGTIDGAIGLIIGLAHFHNLDGLCILQPLADKESLEIAALRLFKYLVSILESTKE